MGQRSNLDLYRLEAKYQAKQRDERELIAKHGPPIPDASHPDWQLALNAISVPMFAEDERERLALNRQFVAQMNRQQPRPDAALSRVALQLNLTPAEQEAVRRSLNDRTAAPDNTVGNPEPNQMAVYGTRFSAFQKKIAAMKCTDAASFKACMKQIRSMIDADDDGGERSENSRSSAASGRYTNFGTFTVYNPNVPNRR